MTIPLEKSMLAVAIFQLLAFTSSEMLTGNMTFLQQSALEQFRNLVSPALYRDFMKRDEYLIRWLLDQDYNLNQAQDKLLTSIKWRKENGIDSIVDKEDFADIERLCQYSIDGRDKLGRPILTGAIGNCPVRRIVLGGNYKKLHRMLYFAYEAASSIVHELQKEGKPVADIIVIFDINHFSMRQHGCIRCIPIGLDAVTLYESYYPLYISQIFVINVPRIAENLWPILFPLLSERTKKSLHIYGYNLKEWQAAISKYVDADQLDQSLGGKRPKRKFIPFKKTKDYQLIYASRLNETAS